MEALNDYDDVTVVNMGVAPPSATSDSSAIAAARTLRRKVSGGVS